METIDEEITDRALAWMEKQVKADKPFFLWYNSTAMHFRSHVAAKNIGKSGQDPYSDRMVTHDEQIGQMLKKLDELGIADNTIVMLQGILLDFWQRPIPVDGGKFFGDVGLAGPDAGKGGKFLILPPDYKGAVPEGYFVYRSGTYNVFIFLRGFYEDPKNLTPAVAHLEKTRIYPLNGEAGARPMKFPDASGVPANMVPRN